jgi:hypothetical protein
MVAILLKGKGGTLPPEPVVFTKDYVKHRLLSTKKYPQGTSGLVVKSHKGLLGGVTIMTSACQTASSYVECPSITSRSIADAR